MLTRLSQAVFMTLALYLLAGLSSSIDGQSLEAETIQPSAVEAQVIPHKTWISIVNFRR